MLTHCSTGPTAANYRFAALIRCVSHWLCLYSAQANQIVGFVLRFLPGISGSIFMGDFHSALPITGIDSLNELSEVGKCSGLVMMNQVILDLFRKAVICLSEECCLAPLNMCG